MGSAWSIGCCWAGHDLEDECDDSTKVCPYLVLWFGLSKYVCFCVLFPSGCTSVTFVAVSEPTSRSLMRITVHPGLSTASSALEAQRQLGRSALTNHGHWWEVVAAWWTCG